MNTTFRVNNPGLCKFALAVTGFTQVLDMTIANVSLPAIAGNLGATTQQSAWVITSFAVCNAIALPLTGWLVRRVGEVRLFVAATILFTLASLLCGAAASMGMLTIARALQGFVAGPISPVTQALLISLFPADKRSHAIVLSTAVIIVAPIFGPILGGWITDNFSWPWIFFINVPIGLCASFFVWTQMRHKPLQIQRTPMDYMGFVLLALGVGALQIMFDMGNEEDWFDSSFIIATAIIAAICVPAFLIWSLHEKQPIFDLHLFQRRNFTVGTLGAGLTTGALLSSMVLLPMWLQTQMHYTPLWAGLAIAPAGIAPFLLMSALGKHAHLVDLRLLATVGIIIMAVMMFVISSYTLEVDFATVAIHQLIRGIGLPMVTVAATTILISSLRPEEISSGTGLSLCLRSLMNSFFISLSQYEWNHRAVVHHAHLAERFAPGSPATVDAVRSLGQGDPQLAMSRLDQMVTAQAFQISFNEMYFGIGALFLVLSLFIWLAKPPFKPGGER